jgi:hypothetical protein
MKGSLVWLVLPILLALTGGATRAQRVDVGITADEDGLRSFHLAIGDYYRVPAPDVMAVRDHGIPDDELPVVFFLAARSKVSPDTIVDLRLGGWSWDRITVHFGLGPDIYYVPCPVVVQGPPYGHAYGHYRKHPRGEWKKIHLDDDDVVNLVGLRFVSEHEGVPPQDVIRLRSDGRPFVAVASEVRKAKEHRDGGRSHKGQSKGDGDKHGHGEGKGHGKKE